MPERVEFELQGCFQVGSHDGFNHFKAYVRPINAAARSLIRERGKAGGPYVLSSLSQSIQDRAWELMRRDMRLVAARMIERETDGDYLVR